MSKYGVFSGPYFPAFGLNTNTVCSVRIRLCIQNVIYNFRATSGFFKKGDFRRSFTQKYLKMTYLWKKRHFFVKHDKRQRPTTGCWFLLDYSLVFGHFSHSDIFITYLWRCVRHVLDSVFCISNICNQMMEMFLKIIVGSQRRMIIRKLTCYSKLILLANVEPFTQREPCSPMLLILLLMLDSVITGTLTKAVLRKCFIKKVFYKFHKSHRKTPASESLFW